MLGCLCVWARSGKQQITVVSELSPSDHRRPGFKLYSQGGILLATALGSALAGAILLSQNFKRLGQPDSARNTIILGLVTLGAVLLAIFVEPQSVELPEVLYQVVQVGVVYLYVRWTQADILDEHGRIGGEYYSNWRAAGISIVVAAIVFAVGFGLFLILSVLSDTLNDRGVNHFNKGEYDRAIQNYDYAIQLNSEFALAFNNRGEAYRRKGEYDRAIADFDQAIQLDTLEGPRKAWPFSNRGGAYLAKGDHDRAIADFDQAIKLKSDFVAAFYKRGLVYANKGEYVRMIADYD